MVNFDIQGTFSDGRWFSPLQRRFKLTDLTKIDLPIAKSETEKDILESRLVFSVNEKEKLDNIFYLTFAIAWFFKKFV